MDDVCEGCAEGRGDALKTENGERGQESGSRTLDGWMIRMTG